MALKDPVVGDYVESYSTRVLGRVTEVNNKFGWFKVLFLNGRVFEYRMGNRDNQALRKVDAEKVADYYLGLENSQLTDSWNE